MIDVMSFLLEIIAVGIGVFGGFIANIFLQKWLERRQSIRVLKLLRKELELNLDIIRTIIRSNVKAWKVPYAPLELGIWKAISNKIDLITNDVTLDAIAKVYYQFDTLEKTLESFADDAAAYDPQAADKTKKEIAKRVISHRDAILDHLREPKDAKDKTVIFFITTAISEVEKEITRLDC